MLRIVTPAEYLLPEPFAFVFVKFFDVGAALRPHYALTPVTAK